MKADVDINLKAHADQAVGKLKQVSKELKNAAEAADASGAIPSQASAPTIGKTLGKALVGYVAHEGLSTIATVVGNRSGGARTGNRIASIGGGALSSSHIATANAQTLGERDRAFERLQSVRQRPEQIRELQTRLTTLRFGDGPNAIRNLQSRILKAEEEGATDNVDYLNDKDLFARQKGREATLMRQLEELRMPTLGAPVRASDVGDSLGAMGGQVGAQVDVADVNRSQLEVLKQILEKISAPGRLPADAATPLFDKSFYQ